MVRNKRKRKVAVANNEEKENETETATVVSAPAHNNGPMYKIMSHAQTSETLHKKYVKEMQQLYTKMDHDAFMFTFIRMIKSAMQCDETNEYALTSLQFCAKFVASYDDDDDTHPVLIGTFEWISQTISNNPHIRFRLCQFVNLILSALGLEAALDDAICDKILEYMVDRLRDMSPSVRVQAIVAMQRLQVPDNPNDPVVRAYQFHLCSDPSPRVRQAVITCMGRNYITIPYILDRLWDIDEKVRRHTYLHMSSYPVRSYKVSQRLMLLEQGLNDRAESVRKVVTKVLLRQWLESYQKDIISLISALKLDANEAEFERFRKVSKQTLLEVFKSEDRKTLIDSLPLDYEGEFNRCVLHENLSVEIALYWQCLSDFLQTKAADEFDIILPELSVFCAYIENFCAQNQQTDGDNFQRLEFKYKLLALLEILYKYDLGDEIGRENLKKLIGHLLRNFSLDDKNIEMIVRCAENLMTDQNTRMQFFTDIVRELCQLNKEQNNLWNDRTLINEALAKCADPALNLKLSELKVKILDLEEQEMLLLEKKNYVKAQEVTEQKNIATEEYTNLLKPLLSQPLAIKKVKNENIITSLQIIFHMVVSDKVRSLSPQVCKLYNDFICRHLASVPIIRGWALKCGTAYSMHYEPIAKDLFAELYSQFFKNHSIRLWEISVKCIFEIMDLYGINTFTTREEANTSKRSGRVLYNTLETLDTDDETQVSVDGQSVDIIHMMSHFLDTCANVSIVSEIVLGFIKLILHGFISSGDVIEKLLIRYFNPSTDTKIHQYLSIFLDEMIRLNKQGLLVPSLLPTVKAVLSAPYDSPLLEIRPETITRFFIDITRPDTSSKRKTNLHNKIAHSFLTEMLSNANSKELCKLLAKEILKLEIDVRNNATLKKDMIDMSNKLLLCEFDVNTLKNLNNFVDMIHGTFNPPARTENDSDDDADEDTLTNQNRRNTTSVTTTTTTTTTTMAATTPVENIATTALQEESESTLTTSQTNNIIQEDCNLAAAETEKATSESNITSTDESPPTTASTVANNIESSQNSETVVQTSESTEISAMPIPPKTPTTTEIAAAPVTTYGRQNTVGQYCLRKSLNSPRVQSESEMSDSTPVPKIRIELRIDSEKKKTNEQENDKGTHSANKTPKAISSNSGHFLRQLRGRPKSVSPKPIIDSGSECSDEEINESDVVLESPQPQRDTTRLNLTVTRLNRAARIPTRSTEPRQTRTTRKNTRIESEPQPSPTRRQTPQKAPTLSKKSHVKSPRKVLYTNLTPKTGLKRAFPKTPKPKNKPKPTESSTDSTSSSSKSPQAKQPRHNKLTPKSRTPQQRKSTNTKSNSIKKKNPTVSTRNEVIKKMLPPSKIPVKTTRATSASSSTGQSRSSSSSPLRKNINTRNTQPITRSRSLDRRTRSKIPRKLT